MLWENLTVSEFNGAVSSSKGVCVIPIGCLEKHGDHLPLGTDMLIAREIVVRASKQESVVIFPYYPFGQVSEVRHKLGTIAIPYELQMKVLEAVCEEIYRNGFTKIILGNGHGGNNMFLRYFAQAMLDKQRPYSIFVYDLWIINGEQNEYLQTKYGYVNEYGHADIYETSDILAIDPTLVHMERVIQEQSHSRHRMDEFNEHQIFTGISWYGDYPEQFAGDPSGATAEYGEDILNFNVENFIKVLKIIKNDTLVSSLEKEFYDAGYSPFI